MTLAQEEIFGPVACVLRFSTEDEAIEICNGTAYGLTAAICTTDLVRAGQIARRLEVGMVFVNNYMRRASSARRSGASRAVVSAARTLRRHCTSSCAPRTSGSLRARRDTGLAPAGLTPPGIPDPAGSVIPMAVTHSVAS